MASGNLLLLTALCPCFTRSLPLMVLVSLRQISSFSVISLRLSFFRIFSNSRSASKKLPALNNFSALVRVVSILLFFWPFFYSKKTPIVIPGSRGLSSTRQSFWFKQYRLIIPFRVSPDRTRYFQKGLFCL